MDRDLLIRLGESIYGPNWKLPLARELGYNQRTVRRWANGKFKIPPGVTAHLKRLAADRVSEIKKLETSLGLGS